MKPNLVQNYKIQPPFQKQSFESTDINSLPNRTYSEPLPPKGRLVRNGLLNSPSVMVNDARYDIRAIKDAWKGKAKDHQLGKINDIGMKLGGLAIAGYLFTKKSAPSTKLMEFIGFGSFFASMALWPKLALGIPARIIHGVNIHKKYETKQNVYDEKSLMVKKPFYQDPQYIPWDLYKDEEIQKIGDRLGVDKDLPNRREFIQEKMKKIALQNNTLWMLTAGFATPIMSALICNQAEKVLVPFIDKRNNKIADELMKPEKLEEFAKKYNFYPQKAELNALLNLKIGETFDKDLVSKITKAIKADLDPIVANGLFEDLSKKYLGKGAIIDDTAIDYLMNVVPEEFKNSPIDLKTLPSRENLVKFFEDRGKFNIALGPDDIKTLPNDLKKYFKSFVKEQLANDIDAFDDFTSKIFKISQDAFKVTPSRILTVEDADELKELQRIIAKSSAKINVFSEYSFRKVANSQETALANYWNKVANPLPKLLGITKKEMADARYDRLFVQELLDKKLVEIAANPEKLKNVMNHLVSQIAELDTRFPDSATNEFGAKIDEIYDGLGDFLKGKGFKNAAKNLVGNAWDRGGEAGSSKLAQKTFFKERISGVRYSFYRVIETFDVYRRIATIQNNPHFSSMSKPAQEEMLRLVKQTTLAGHSSDYAVKFNQQYPNDAKMFKQVSEFLFGNGGLSEEVASALDSKSLRVKFTDYKVAMINKVINAVNDFKPRHVLGQVVEATPMEKFLLVGIAPDELLTQLVNNSFNSSKWLKKFGSIGLGVLGLTVASQFLFGKLDPNPRPRRHHHHTHEAADKGVKKG